MSLYRMLRDAGTRGWPGRAGGQSCPGLQQGESLAHYKEKERLP